MNMVLVDVENVGVAWNCFKPGWALSFVNDFYEFMFNTE